MKKVELRDKEHFCAEKPLYKFLSCEYSFANLVIWAELYDIRWKNIEGIPLIYIGRDVICLFPQAPDQSAGTLVEILKSLKNDGINASMSLVPEEFVNQNPQLDQFFIVDENNDYSDYIHSTERLLFLQGKKLRKKRNLISQFLNQNPHYKDSKISKEHFDSCLQLAVKNVVPGDDAEKKEEIIAIKRAFSLFNELELDGRVITVDEKIVAFSVFSKHIDGTYVVHFEKSNKEYVGSAQLINMKTAEYLLDKCEFINREQDLGVPGLRKAKKSYDPDAMLTNYELTLRPEIA